MKNIELCDLEQGTKEWHEARAGRITGTRLGRVMSAKKDTRMELIYELIYEKIAPLQDIYQSDTMARWHVIESIVKELYDGRNIQSVGFIKRTDNTFIGISPDGIEIAENGDIKHAVEVKGPLGKNLVKYWLEDKIPSEYFWQVVHYFLVIDTLETLDFIIHNPEPFDDMVRTKTIRVTREELQEQITQAEYALCNFQGEYETALKQFVANVVAHSKK